MAAGLSQPADQQHQGAPSEISLLGWAASMLAAPSHAEAPGDLSEREVLQRLSVWLTERGADMSMVEVRTSQV